MRNFKINPELEKCLPPLSDIEYGNLKNSIETKGYDEAKPIVIWKEEPDTIVDGHHRYKICCELEIEPKWVVKSFKSLDEAILYTLRRQIEQRNLNATQMTLITKQMIPLEEKLKLEEEAREAQYTGRPKKEELPVLGTGTYDSPKEVAKKIAEKANVSTRTVYRVQAVEKDGVPELTKMMEKGDLSAKTANAFVKNIPEKEKQEEIIKDGGVEAVKKTVIDIEDKKEEDKNERLDRLRREKEEMDQELEEYREVLKEQFGDAKYACGIHPSVFMWCDPCKAAFDVYRPNIPTYCPVCGKKDIRMRDDSWYPGKKVI